MERYCSTGQSPQRAVAPTEEEEYDIWDMSLCTDDRLVCSLIQTSTLNGHIYRVTYTRCRINTINSPDDGHMAARNMYRIEINIHEKELCVKLVTYKDYNKNP